MTWALASGCSHSIRSNPAHNHISIRPRAGALSISSHLLDHLNLSIETRRATLDEWYISSQTHPIDMASCIEIIKGIENDIERFKPVDSKLTVLYIRVIGVEFRIRPELLRNFFGDLYAGKEPLNFPVDLTDRAAISTYQGLGLLDVLLTEEKLPIQIAQVDSIEINNVDFAKAGELEVLEQFATDASCAH